MPTKEKPAEQEAAAEESLHLFPEGERPKGKFQRIDLDKIGAFNSLQPTPAFVKNLDENGQIQPIVVIDGPHATKPYRIVVGRRRVLAARQLEWTKIDALVFPAGTPRAWAASAAVSENMARSNNVASELENIERLMKETGAPESLVSRELGIPVSRIRKLLKITRLIPELRKPFDKGLISANVAGRAAGLDKKRQQKLVKLFIDNEALTAKDVDALTRARAVEVSNKIDDKVFGGPGADAPLPHTPEDMIQDLETYDNDDVQRVAQAAFAQLKSRNMKLDVMGAEPLFKEGERSWTAAAASLKVFLETLPPMSAARRERMENNVDAMLDSFSKDLKREAKEAEKEADNGANA